MPKKIESGDPLGFLTSILSRISKNIEGDPLWNFFQETSLAMPKKLKGGTLRSPPVLYVTQETFLVQFRGPTAAI